MAQSYTNVLPLSVNTEGDIYIGTDSSGKTTIGYKPNMCINSSNVETKENGLYLTGYIPAKAGDIIRFKNMEYMNITTTPTQYKRSQINTFDENFTPLTSSTHHSLSSLPSAVYQAVYGENGDVIQLTIPSQLNANTAYVRFTVPLLTSKSIITVNEVIALSDTEKKLDDLENRVETLEANQGSGSNSGSGTENIEEVPIYWEAELESKAKEINMTLCEAGRNKSSFLFYTDAHWNQNSQMSPKLLKYLYKHTGINKTFFGGDIVNNESDNYDTMKYLWDWRYQLRDLPNHHSVPGNHDDGNTTEDLFSANYVYGYLQAAEETNDIVRDEGDGLYYYLDCPSEKSRYIFLDTATGYDSGWVSDLGASRQGKFVKNALMSVSDGWHIIVIAHIWHDTNYTVNPAVPGGLSKWGEYLIGQFDAYNSREGEYTQGKGKVEFCIGGHTHWDFESFSPGGIPIILNETDSHHIRSGLDFTLGTITESSISGIIADYNTNTVHIIRVGRGQGRTISITENTVTPEEPVIPDVPDTPDTPVNYTNQLSIAVDENGNIYNGIGYKANVRINSSQEEVAATGWYLTGYIPINEHDMVYMKNMEYMDISGDGGETSRAMMRFYNANLEPVGVSASHSLASPPDSSYYPVFGSNGDLIQFRVPNWEDEFAYMRIQCGYLDENSIITVNQPIEDSEEPENPSTSYTNVLDAAGYKTNTRLSVSSGSFDERTESGWCTSGLIPAVAKDTIRLKNCTFTKSTTAATHRGGIYGANSDGSYSGQMVSISQITNGVVYDESGDNVIEFTVPSSIKSPGYVRIVVQNFNENSIVTVNEEID